MKKLIFLILLFPLLSIAQVPLVYDGKLVVLGSTFSPLDYTPIAWYDSQDLATITKDGSNYVSSWANKSSTGSAYNLEQLTGANQPLYSATNGIVFDGVNDYMFKSFGVFYNQPLTVVIVHKHTSTVFHDPAPLIDFRKVGNDGATATRSSETLIYMDVPLIEYFTSYEHKYNYVNSFFVMNGANSKIYQDNTLKVSGTLNTLSVDNIYLCSNYVQSVFSPSNIKSIIIYPSALTETQILNLNIYLNDTY